MSKRLAGALVLVTCLTLTASVARAQGPGTNTWLCALTSAVECENDGDCQRRTLEQVAVSRFHMIDVGKRTITVVDLAAAGRTATLDRVDRASGQLFLQSVQGGRAISVVLAEVTGHLSASVVEAGTVFALAGACTPVVDAK